MNLFQDPSGRQSLSPGLEASLRLAKHCTTSKPRNPPRLLELVNDGRETSSVPSSSSYQNELENIDGSNAQQEASEHVHPGGMATIERSSRWQVRLLDGLNRGGSKDGVGRSSSDDDRAGSLTGVSANISQRRPWTFTKPALSADIVELPQQSPLKNVMNFARIEEKIIQAKIRYALAEKAASRERQANGISTRPAQRRLRETYQCLTELYGAREAIMRDRMRTMIFHKSKSENDRASTRENGNGSMLAPQSRQRSDSSARASGEKPNAAGSMAGSETNSEIMTNQSVIAPQEPRRHALTDVETFIDK